MIFFEKQIAQYRDIGKISLAFFKILAYRANLRSLCIHELIR